MSRREVLSEGVFKLMAPWDNAPAQNVVNNVLIQATQVNPKITATGTNFGAGKAVAVKRIQRTQLNKSDIKREVKIVEKISDQHPNILLLICFEMNADYLFIIATDLCSGTLQDYIDRKYVGAKFKSEKEILHQVTQGLAQNT